MTTTQTRDQLSYQRDLAREEVKSLKEENEKLQHWKDENEPDFEREQEENQKLWLENKKDECEKWKEEDREDREDRERECELLREENEKLKEERDCFKASYDEGDEFLRSLQHTHYKHIKCLEEEAMDNKELRKENEKLKERWEEQKEWWKDQNDRRQKLKEENDKLKEEVKALEEVHIIFTNQKATIIEGYEIQQKELAEIKSQNIQNCSTNKKLRDILDKMECYECEHCVNWRGVYVEERYENGKIKKWCCESCMYELTEIQNL